jgi:hypothetical protein
MTNYDIDASCGGKRRGCCLIELPNDSEPTEVIAHQRTQRILLFVPGLLSGGSPTWAVVSIPDSEATYTVGQATR